jgi:hypothetical protein
MVCMSQVWIAMNEIENGIKESMIKHQVTNVQGCGRWVRWWGCSLFVIYGWMKTTPQTYIPAMLGSMSEMEVEDNNSPVALLPGQNFNLDDHSDDGAESDD